MGLFSLHVLDNDKYICVRTTYDMHNVSLWISQGWASIKSHGLLQRSSPKVRHNENVHKVKLKPPWAQLRCTRKCNSNQKTKLKEAIQFQMVQVQLYRPQISAQISLVCIAFNKAWTRMNLVLNQKSKVEQTIEQSGTNKLRKNNPTIGSSIKTDKANNENLSFKLNNKPYMP